MFVLLTASRTDLDEGREVSKHMKRIYIGMDLAVTHISWVKLEAKDGNVEKAMPILQRAQERSAIVTARGVRVVPARRA